MAMPVAGGILTEFLSRNTSFSLRIPKLVPTLSTIDPVDSELYT